MTVEYLVMWSLVRGVSEKRRVNGHGLVWHHGVVHGICTWIGVLHRPGPREKQNRTILPGVEEVVARDNIEKADQFHGETSAVLPSKLRNR